MEEYYYELTIEPSQGYETFTQLVTQLTNDAIEEDGTKIIVRSADDLELIQFGIEHFANQMNIPCTCTMEKKKNEDWVNMYCQSIDPVEVGKFYVRPSWFEPKEELINIIIDPALAFGSGHHETTSSCLEAIGKYVQEGHNTIDVGCGSGILGIGAMKLGASCDLCDTDEVAIENTKSNLLINEVSCNKIWTGTINQSAQKYDVVIANIVADVLIMIANDLKKSLKDNGILIISGILDKYHDRVLKKYDTLELIETIRKNEWVTFILRKKD